MTAEVPQLAARVYHYEPQDTRLSRLRDGDWRGVLADAADDPNIGRAPTTIVVTGILWRSAWKDRWLASSGFAATIGTVAPQRRRRPWNTRPTASDKALGRDRITPSANGSR